jgi:hypothetical protein
LLYRRWRKKKWVIQNRKPVSIRILGMGHGDRVEKAKMYTLIYTIIPGQKEEQ